MEAPTSELVKKYLLEVKLTRPISGRESGYDVAKAKRMLGFQAMLRDCVLWPRRLANLSRKDYAERGAKDRLCSHNECVPRQARGGKFSGGSSCRYDDLA
jgi:hypothetical protein